MQDQFNWERTLRRTRIYRGRMSRMVTRRALSAPCVYMHVPKCGGTSLSEALYALVPLDRKIGILDSVSIRRALALHHAGVDEPARFHDEGEEAATIAAFREQLLLAHLCHGCALVHGHFLFSERAFARFGPTHRFVSILRDPVTRTLSNYAMARRNGVFAGDFDAFLASAMGRRMAQHTLRYFAGVATVAPGEEAALVARARANMRRFSAIGFIEDIGPFADRFADIFGVRPAIPHYNRGDTARLDLTPQQLSRLTHLCEPDIALTEYAKTLT